MKHVVISIVKRPNGPKVMSIMTQRTKSYMNHLIPTIQHTIDTHGYEGLDARDAISNSIRKACKDKDFVKVDIEFMSIKDGMIQEYS